ncbi:hypothetical protein K1719_043234 [Acacia pycnantha]|nr:hypothetical protein K1719_043234 [Acacia pycnantha]
MLVINEGKPIKSRRVDKRTRESREAMTVQRGGILSITMGEAQCGSENNDIDLLKCNEDKCIQCLLDAKSVPYDPGTDSHNTPDHDQETIEPSLASPMPGYIEEHMRNDDIFTVLAETRAEDASCFCGLASLAYDSVRVILTVGRFGRELLWESILQLSKGISSLWSVMGDFNDILYANERIGGSRVVVGECNGSTID